MNYKTMNNLYNLTNEELCLSYQEGDEFALDILCNKNSGLVYKVANKVMRDYHPDILDMEDLFVEGNLGIMEAAKRFDIGKGYKFSTYAGYWIKQCMVRSIINTGYGMRLPVYIFENVLKLNRCRKKLGNDSPKELKVMMKKEYGLTCTIDKIKDYLYYADKYNMVVSLNKTNDDEDDSPNELISCIREEGYSDDDLIKNINKEEVHKALDILTDREREVLKMRFGLDGYREMTLEQVGRVYGVTRERIRQIEKEAYKKLRTQKGEELYELLIA